MKEICFRYPCPVLQDLKRLWNCLQKYSNALFVQGPMPGTTVRSILSERKYHVTAGADHMVQIANTTSCGKSLGKMKPASQCQVQNTTHIHKWRVFARRHKRCRLYKSLSPPCAQPWVVLPFDSRFHFLKSRFPAPAFSQASHQADLRISYGTCLEPSWQVHQLTLKKNLFILCPVLSQTSTACQEVC